MPATHRSAAVAHVEFAGFTIDLAQGQLSDRNGRYLPLRPRSLAVLSLLASRIGEVVLKEEIIAKVWHDVVVTEDSLTQCVADIRRVIGDREHGIVRTVPRRGYLLDGVGGHKVGVANTTPLNLPDEGHSPLATRYARSGEFYISYQVTGSGPIDLVFVQGNITHLEMEWENPWPARFFRRLASFSRLIRFDKRGTGLSDRLADLPTLEQRMEDVRAVMDAVGSQRAVLLGSSEGGPMSLLFCATYPERVRSLVLYGTMARSSWAPDHPFGRTDAQLQAMLVSIEKNWGTGSSVERFAPSCAHLPEYRDWRGRLDRAAATPGSAIKLHQMNHGYDVRHVLPFIKVPTLILHRKDDRAVIVEHGRDLARRIPTARYVELEGEDHAPWVGDTEAICSSIENFVGRTAETKSNERALATVLFAEVVPDFAPDANLSEWGSHLREQISRFKGRVCDTRGPGAYAVFDGPVEAVRCGRSIIETSSASGLRVRVSIHMSECNIWDDNLIEDASRIGRALISFGGPGEVIVTSDVSSLVAGSGLSFEQRGQCNVHGHAGTLNAFVVADD